MSFKRFPCGPGRFHSPRLSAKVRPLSEGGSAVRELTGKISFQGAPGAYSHQACVEAFPGLEGLRLRAASRRRSRR